MTQNNYDQGGSTVLSNKNTKNVNFLFIVDMLKDLLAQELITEKEYARAKKYYMTQTSHPVLASKSALSPSKSRNFATSAGKSAKNSTMRA